MSAVRMRRCLFAFACAATLCIASLMLPAHSADLQREKEARALLAEGEKLDEATLLSEALSTFDRVRKEYPDTEAGQFADFWRAQVLARMGRTKEGMEIDRALIEKHPGTVLACWAQYGIAAMTGGSPEGIAAMRKVKEMLPNRADLSPLDLSRVVLGDWCGRYLAGRQDVLDAAEFFGLDRNDPKQKAEALAIVAAHFARTQSLEKAKPILDRLVSECPGEREEAEWAKVEAAIACIDGRECTEEYQQLAVGYLTPYSVLTLSEDDQAAKACLALARYYKRNGRVDEAVAVLKHAVERHSNTSRGAQVLYEYGSALDKQGKSKEAIKALEEMIARKPLSTYATAASTLIEKIRSKAATQTASLDELIKEADANFDPKWQVLASAPIDGSLDDPMMVARQAVALAREGKGESGLKLVNNAVARLSMSPKEVAVARGQVGLCALRTAKEHRRFSSEAAHTLVIALRAPIEGQPPPTDVRARLALEAARVVDEMLTAGVSEEDRAAATVWIAYLLVQEGLHGQAVGALRNALKFARSRGEEVETKYQLGLCYLQLGNRSRARRYMQDIVRQYPTSSRAAEARGYLYQWGYTSPAESDAQQQRSELSDHGQ